MGLLSASQWPAQLIPMNANAAAAISQTPPIDHDPMTLNNARYEELMAENRGTAQFGSHHAEPAGGR